MTPRDADGDLRDQISRIEADIDQLTETLERCRKAILFSTVTITAGGLWFLGYFLGAIKFDSTLMVGAIAATIGGIVILGSNTSTSQQAVAAMKAAETERDELIDTISPRVVDMGRWEPSRPTIH